MILTAPEREKYGISYQGSKTKIIDKIARFFPNADHFYDLFGGGFSVTHYMLENRRKSFKHFHYNEIRPGLCELIKDSIDGKYNYDVFKPEWISRERFMAEKESNAYIKIIWSFANNGKDYLFGEDIENQKRSMHQAVVFDQFDDFMINTFKLNRWPNKLSIQGKKLYLKRIVNQRIELQQLERLEQPILTNLDYRQVLIEPNSVIYCDIPYQGTADYGNTFSHREFFDWAASQQNPLFISEYNVSDERFYLLKEFKHRTTFAKGGNSPVVEKLYGNKIAYDIIQDAIAKKGGK